MALYLSVASIYKSWAGKPATLSCRNCICCSVMQHLHLQPAAGPDNEIYAAQVQGPGPKLAGRPGPQLICGWLIDQVTDSGD